jgi:hypothetical protein
MGLGVSVGVSVGVVPKTVHKYRHMFLSCQSFFNFVNSI